MADGWMDVEKLPGATFSNVTYLNKSSFIVD